MSLGPLTVEQTGQESECPLISQFRILIGSAVKCLQTTLAFVGLSPQTRSLLGLHHPWTPLGGFCPQSPWDTAPK